MSQTWILEVTKKRTIDTRDQPSAFHARDIIYRTPCCGIKVDVGAGKKEANKKNVDNKQMKDKIKECRCKERLVVGEMRASQKGRNRRVGERIDGGRFILLTG